MPSEALAIAETAFVWLSADAANSSSGLGRATGTRGRDIGFRV